MGYLSGTLKHYWHISYVSFFVPSLIHSVSWKVDAVARVLVCHLDHEDREKSRFLKAL